MEKSDNHQHMTFNFHFNGSVGQQIAHVDTIIAHFDKDMNMQVSYADKITPNSSSPSPHTPSPSSLSPQVFPPHTPSPLSPSPSSLPQIPQLSTPEALDLLNKAVALGYLRPDFHPNSEVISDMKASILALVIGNRLQLKSKWVPFEQLWGMKSLRTTHYHAQDTTYYPDVLKEFEQNL